MSRRVPLLLFAVVASSCGLFDFSAPTLRDETTRSGAGTSGAASGGASGAGGSGADGSGGGSSGSGGALGGIGGASSGRGGSGNEGGQGDTPCNELEYAWSDVFQTDGYEETHAVVIDRDDNLFVGDQSNGPDGSRLLVTKFSAARNEVWSTEFAFGADDAELHSLALDANGFIFVSGSFQGRTTIDPSPELVAEGRVSPLL